MNEGDSGHNPAGRQIGVKNKKEKKETHNNTHLNLFGQTINISPWKPASFYLEKNIQINTKQITFIVSNNTFGNLLI